MSTSISIIVPTVGRVNEVRRLFDSLANQDCDDFEVILVDQNKTDCLQKLVEEFVEKFSLIHIKDEGNGASRARNLGVTHSHGNILVWPDDDSWYPPNLLSTIQNYFKLNSNTDGIIGQLMDENNQPHPRRFPKKVKKARIMDTFVFGAEPVLSFTRKSFSDLLGFDENLGVGAGTPWGAGEGTDLCVRAINSGMKLLLNRDFIVFHEKHKIQTGNRKQINKAKSYAMGMGAVLKKNKLPFMFTIQYFLLYFRALTWNVIRLKGGTLKFHFSRLIGVIEGFISLRN